MVDLENVSPEVKAKLEARARAKTDKMFLAREVLAYDFQDDVHQELFDQYIPYDEAIPWVEQAPIKNRLILWSRGMYKSTSIVVEIIQAILNFPDIRILIMQGGLKTTRGLLKEIAAHFQGLAPRSKLMELFPEYCGDKKALKLTQDTFTTTARTKLHLQQATVNVASPKAIKTGQHYECGFFDDLVHAENYRSKTQLSKAEADFKMCIPLIDPGGYRFVTGTRYAFGDMYENIIRHNKGEWIISLKTCWADDGKTPRFTQRKANDGRLIGFTREGLLQIQQDDPGMFASQYLNSPIAEGQQLFTEQMLLAACVPPDQTPLLSQTVLFVDCATTDSAWSDDSVIIAGKTDALGKMYVVDIAGGQWLPDVFARQVIMMTLKHRPLRVLIEKSASGMYMESMLRMVAGQMGVILPIQLVPCKNVKDAKAIRISALQAYLRTGRLKFFMGLPCWDKVVKQFTEFPRGKHDDYCDTIALMASEFNSGVSYNAQLTAKKHTMMHMIEMAGQSTTNTVLDTRKEPSCDEIGSDFCY